MLSDPSRMRGQPVSGRRITGKSQRRLRVSGPTMTLQAPGSADNLYN